ncbi:MAG TPA: integrase core domain-containing protein [Lacunisphaera sp.]|nr:integrase core domain-containing protein [Lacunisphaera sp.]
MPWKITDKEKVRREFIAARWQNKESMTALCRHFGITRQCGYEWWRRAQSRDPQMADRSHRTRCAEMLAARWWPRIQRLRRRYRFAGAGQLLWYLQRTYPLGPWPAARTIGRWLAKVGLTRKRRRRALPGPVIRLPVLRASAPNEIWTVDFKGWFRTADGRRVCALTVRDLATRYILYVGHMERTTERAVAAVMRRLFRRYGLPRAIQVDNGPPFGGYGPYGWSTLAVGWVRLGIGVRYGRPACPQDNAAHEQMHQVLQQQTAAPAAASLQAQQRRFERWRRRYNHDRPHRALGMQLPASLYRPTPCRPTPLVWRYPSHWIVKTIDPRGRIRWSGRARLIGQAFGRQLIALRPERHGVVSVHFGPHLLGHLHAADTTAIRLVRAILPRNPHTQSDKGGS